MGSVRKYSAGKGSARVATDRGGWAETDGIPRHEVLTDSLYAAVLHTTRQI